MPDLGWTEGPVHCTDLVDETGKVFGYVGPRSIGTRGYVVQAGSEWPPRPAAFSDHASTDAARTWVEAEVTARAFQPVRILRAAESSALAVQGVVPRDAVRPADRNG